MNPPPQKISENKFVHRNKDTNDMARNDILHVRLKLFVPFHLFQFLQLVLSKQMPDMLTNT